MCSILSANVLYYSESHKMKGTAHALFRVASRHRMCYEIIGDHAHNRAITLITEAITLITEAITFVTEAYRILRLTKIKYYSNSPI